MSENITIPPETPIEHLLKSLKVTAGCRFIAVKRLENHDKKLTRVTAFASAYVIALTVMPCFVKLPMQIADLYNLVTVALSVVILVSSLLQYSAGDVVNAEQHHRSALEMNEIHRLLLLRAANAISEEELRQFFERYNAVLQKYSINHDDIDFLQYQLQRPEMYPWVDWKGRLKIYAVLIWSRHFISFLLIGMTFCMIALGVYGFKQASRNENNSKTLTVGHALLRSLS